MTAEKIPIEQFLFKATQLIPQPAGNDERYSSFDLIKANYEEFLTAANDTYKWLHRQAVHQIMEMEKIISKPDPRLPSDFLEYLRYCRSLCRRINDSLAWVMLGSQRHVIHRICHWKQRPYLKDCNPESIQRVMDHLHEDPLTLAIWNDATSCVDMSDLTIRDMTGFRFLEVKEGTVNDEIFDILSKDDENEKRNGWLGFLEKRGERGAEQVLRYFRQTTREEAIIDILKEDKGYDPVLEENVHLISTSTIRESYDSTLQELLTQAQKCGKAVDLVDGCLWLYVSFENRKTFQELVDDFSGMIAQQDPTVMRYLSDTFNVKTLIPLEVPNSEINVPVARPIFLRGLSPQEIFDILYGRLRNRILMFLDYQGLGKLLSESGGKLVWSSEKQGRREKAKPKRKRSILIEDRIPIIYVEDINLFLGDTHLIEIFFDGIRPKTIVAEWIEKARVFRKLKKDSNGLDEKTQIP